MECGREYKQYQNWQIKRKTSQIFPGSPVVKTLHSPAGVTGSISGAVDQDLTHAAWCSQKNKIK